MTVRQSILKFFYPVIINAGKWLGLKAGKRVNADHISPLSPFYNLDAVANSGAAINFYLFKGKKVLIVNTASDCGYTKQFDALQELHEKFGNQLVVLGFPSNDFKEQEKGSDEEVAAFCKINFGVTFPLMKKSVVRKTEGQNAVYKWLSSKEQNGWNDKAPEWNFSKYLIDENGVLTHYFGPGVSPLDNLVVEELRS